MDLAAAEATTLAIAAGGSFVVLAGVALWTRRARRALARRLDALALRLDAPPPAAGSHGLEATLSRLERGAQRAAEKVDDAATNVTRLTHALGGLPQGVVVCDEHGMVVHRNGVAATFVGPAHADTLAEDAVMEVLLAARNGRSVSRWLDVYGPPRRRLSIAGAPIDDGRRAIGAVAVIEDVSERLQLEEIRRDFVANVTHELKTPLGKLGALAETLADSVGASGAGTEAEAAVAKRLAARVEREATRVAGVIDDLLDLSRVEAETSPTLEPVPVHLIVAAAVEQVRSEAARRGITLDVAEPPVWQSVRGDRRQLAAALSKLLDNAVRYSPDGATVVLTVRADGRSVYLVVQDQGGGIPARDLPRIFERFYRVDRSRGRVQAGSGLGLAIARHVAEKHEGEVLVDSREGEGSTFTLRLPAMPGPAGVVGETA